MKEAVLLNVYLEEIHRIIEGVRVERRKLTQLRNEGGGNLCWLNS